ncbi:uncharacterized protein RCC_09100 [Ramularia collo-cygni]|uniref:Uncharacterized protein n=1 Tax=Ramularia collo-cygni TaxID=112498 RepID=A0A2D3V1W5_9PEZI|nr:uncharacterized protein RCC_09100 [Ramularia collo-cygni]CZT23386.1 uncharacterized protein RCC_09100 [Ramularia collo-cygni]
MFSLPIPQILISLHHEGNTTTTNTATNNNNKTSRSSLSSNFGRRLASTLQNMSNNISTAADELSEELSALLEATSLPKASTREELYSFFDDGFDDDAEEIIPGSAAASTSNTPKSPAVAMFETSRRGEIPLGYFPLDAIATSTSSSSSSSSPKIGDFMTRSEGRFDCNWRRQSLDWAKGSEGMTMMMMGMVDDEGYHSSSENATDEEEGDLGDGDVEDEEDQEEREAMLPAKRFSWRNSSPERCSLLYWEE